MLTIKGSTDGTEFRHVFARAALVLAYIAEYNSHTKSTELTEGTRYARAYHPGCVGGDDLDSYVLLFLCQKKTRTSVLMSKRNCSPVKKETKNESQTKSKASE